jgi:hypothetical protein
MNPVIIKILGSPCAVSDQYMEYVREIADAIKLNYTIEKIEDEIIIQGYGVQIACLLGYCPGCSSMAKENPGVKQVPSMVVNEELVFHSGFPGDDIIKSVFLQKSQKNSPVL